MEHCLSSKLCAKLEIMGIKTYELIKTSFKEEAMGFMQVFVWVCVTEHDHTYTRSGKHPLKSNYGVVAKYVIW
jgi:hypothetical protein